MLLCQRVIEVCVRVALRVQRWASCFEDATVYITSQEGCPCVCGRLSEGPHLPRVAQLIPHFPSPQGLAKRVTERRLRTCMSATNRMRIGTVRESQNLVPWNKLPLVSASDEMFEYTTAAIAVGFFPSTETLVPAPAARVKDGIRGTAPSEPLNMTQTWICLI